VAHFTPASLSLQINGTLLVFTVSEEWFHGMDQPPALRFNAFNAEDESQYDLRLSPEEIDKLVPEFAGYRASEDHDDPLPSKTEAARAKMGKHTARAGQAKNSAMAAPPVRHLYLYSIMDKLQLMPKPDSDVAALGPSDSHYDLVVRGSVPPSASSQPRQKGRAPRGTAKATASASLGPTEEAVSVTKQLTLSNAAQLELQEPAFEEVHKTLKYLDRELYTMTISVLESQGGGQSSDSGSGGSVASQVKFAVFDPETEETAELVCEREEVAILVDVAMSQAAVDAPTRALSRTDKLADRHDLLHYLENRLRLKTKTAAKVVAWGADEGGQDGEGGEGGEGGEKGSKGLAHRMLHFEHEKTEKEIEIERERESREMFKQREIQRRQDKVRHFTSFGWRLPIAGSDVEEEGGSGGDASAVGTSGGSGDGVYALVTILRAPAPACVELRVSIPKTGGTMGMVLTEDQLWEQHMPPPPVNAAEAWNKKWARAMVDRLAVDSVQALRGGSREGSRQAKQTQPATQMMRLVLQPPRPMVQQSVCLACGERRGVTRQHYMKLQVWRIESDLTPPPGSTISGGLGARRAGQPLGAGESAVPKPDTVRVVAWDPSGGNQHRAAVGAELALDLTDDDLGKLRLQLPNDGSRLLPDARRWWLGQFVRTLELVPVAPPLTAAPGVFASMRLHYDSASNAPLSSAAGKGGRGTSFAGNVGSHHDVTDKLMHQKTRRFGEEAWLISVRLMGVNASATAASLTASGVLSDNEDDEEGDLLVTAVSEDKPGTSQGLGKTSQSRSMMLRLIVGADKAAEFGGVRRVADAVQLIGGVLSLPTPRLLLKQGVRFEDEKASYLICSVVEELSEATDYAGGVRVEGYEFASCSSCELRLKRQELVELTLLSQAERYPVRAGVSRGAPADTASTPHSMTPQRCKTLLEMLVLERDAPKPGKAAKFRLQLKPAEQIHKVLQQQAEEAARAEAAVSIQSKIRQGRAKAEAGSRLEQMAATERAERTTTLYSAGINLGDGSGGTGAYCIVSLRSSQKAMEEIMPTMEVHALEVEAGAVHRLHDMPAPRWAADADAKTEHCRKFVSQLELVQAEALEAEDAPAGVAVERKILRRRQPLNAAEQRAKVEEWRADAMATFVSIMQDDNLDALRHILGTIEGSANAQFVDNHTPLHLAAADGNLAFAKVLVDFGADVNSVTESFNATPSMYAVPGTIASGADGMGDAARVQTLSFLLALPNLDPTVRGSGGWCEAMTVYDVAGAHGVY
jgi:hypothetical protein